MPRHVMFSVLLSVFCSALAYFSVGLPLAVLSGWAVNVVHCGPVLAGLIISAQYVATVISRLAVGPMIDGTGPRRSILIGFGFCIASGLVTVLADTIHASSMALYAIVFAGRILLGINESLVSTSAMAWGVSRAGVTHTARIISWNGIATFGAIGLGAPVGVWVFGHGGLAGIGWAECAVGLCGLAFAWPQGEVPPLAKARVPLRDVFATVMPYGAILALGTLGFGVITSFVTLLFAARGWGNAWMALSAYGAAFVLSRVFFAGKILLWGPLRISAGFMLIEAAGLVVVASASGPLMAIAGSCLTGFGFALVFPSLGSMVVDRVGAQSRGTAIGVFALFLDVSLSISGPVAGWTAGTLGFSAPFYLSALVAVAAAGGAWALRHKVAQIG